MFAPVDLDFSWALGGTKMTHPFLTAVLSPISCPASCRGFSIGGLHLFDWPGHYSAAGGRVVSSIRQRYGRRGAAAARARGFSMMRAPGDQ